MRTCRSKACNPLSWPCSSEMFHTSARENYRQNLSGSKLAGLLADCDLSSGSASADCLFSHLPGRQVAPQGNRSEMTEEVRNPSPGQACIRKLNQPLSEEGRGTRTRPQQNGFLAPAGWLAGPDGLHSPCCSLASACRSSRLHPS